jgi:CBS domain-containing protein
MNQQDYVRVRDVMTPHVIRIEGLATVRQAMDLMRTANVGSLVVERRHEGDEFALVTVGDIAEKVVALNVSPDRTNVYEIMSKPVLTVDVNMDIKYASRLLSRFGLSHALVTEANELAGVVTLRDMVLRYIPTGGEAPAAEI